MTATKPGERSYKRSWKNLLLNKRYQLRFTLFMVGFASLLMLGLGIWVMRVANETTMVSMASVRGEACPKVPWLGDAAVDEEAAPAVPMRLDENHDGSVGDTPPAAAPASEQTPAPANDPANAPAAPTTAGDPAAAAPPSPASPPVADDEPRHVQVHINESSMTLSSTVPPDLADRIAAHWSCELRQAGKIDRLERGRARILWAMIGTGVVLVLGLAVYGIKMTHRVAGPLFKVSLYLSKMRAGRFDKVYNLRKGDQLVEFYDHFKQAHGGIVTLQRDDIVRIAAVIAAAEAAGAGQHPEIVELRALLERKEKSIE